MEQSSLIDRDTDIIFSRYLQAQPLKIPAFSIPQLHLFYIGDHSASIFHTPVRLNFSALNYHLFQKNCCPSPACALCKPYFLYCPRFAALMREKLFTSAAQLLGNRWHCASDKKKIDWLLNGISTTDFQINVRLFQLAQSFILLSNRSCFKVAVCVFLYLFILFLFCFVFPFCSFAFLWVCVFDLARAFVLIFKTLKINSIIKLSRWAL